MDKEKYWRVFLKTDYRFKGLLWKKYYYLSNQQISKEISIGDFKINKNTQKEVYSINSKDIPNFHIVNIIQVQIDDEFKETDKSEIAIKLTNHGKTYYEDSNFLIHYNEKGLNKWHTGLYNHHYTPIYNTDNKVISLILKSGDKDKKFKNIRLIFYQQYQD
jgi:hypothetical protein